MKLFRTPKTVNRQTLLGWADEPSVSTTFPVPTQPSVISIQVEGGAHRYDLSMTYDEWYALRERVNALIKSYEAMQPKEPRP